MLVLTRKSGESLIIGENIEITIVSVRGNQVKIGVQAPGNVTIYRKELYERIKRENVEAARAKKEEISALAKLLGRKRSKNEGQE